ncbi:MAG: FxLYD domain-containing protein [Thermoproteota archaeon]|nr:FxLYD domain-containing protein [Thermoproteota archaeon]
MPRQSKITNMSAAYQKTPLINAFMIMGFVHNLSNESGNPSLLVEAFDKNNTLIDTATGGLLLHNLMPGDKSPFKIPMFTNASDFDHYYLRIVGPLIPN